jgi:hypothetical protein
VESVAFFCFETHTEIGEEKILLIHEEYAMNPMLKKTEFLAAFMILGLACATANQSPGSINNRERKNDEMQAAVALAKMGVPVQQDPSGHVRWIEAADGELSDEALALMPRLPYLEWLEIGGGKVTQSGVKHLKDCPSLRRLFVRDINLGGDDLTWLSSLSHLEALSLARTHIDGKPLKNISAVETLTVLNLSGNKITNDDMDQVARLKYLEVLALADTDISGAGVAKLEGMVRLNELNLMNCQVLDDDIPSFLSMPNLRIVYARGCNISDIAIAQVVSKFPMLAIFR